MTFSKKIQGGLMLSGCTLMALGAVPAFAATDSTSTSVTITAGALTIDSPTTATLSAITLGTSAQNSTGSISGTQIQDLRGNLGGWSANVSFTNLTGGTDNTKFILLAGETGSSLTNKYLTVTPSTVTTNSGDSSNLTAYNSASQISSLTTTAGAGASNSFSIATAASDHGAGTYNVDVGLNLSIPSYGYYSTTGTGITGQTYSGTATYQVS